MSGPEPPDWALPGWDAVPDDRSPGRRPAGRDPRPAADPPLASSTAGPARTTAAGTFGLRILNVSEVTRAVRGAIRSDPRLTDLWVEGEVGRVTISSAGHAYFALKDDRAQLQCVWFRDDRSRSPFEPQTGLRVVAHGRIDLFEPNGALQLYVESMQPAGFGDLALRYEALKARLAAAGLFDPARKRTLPVRPATIGVITSPSGAVWRDICQVLARRWPLARVVLVAAQVQGDAAPASIVGAFRRLERWIERARMDGREDEAPAVTILARGGGSLEDLWPFNDERVVRAVVAHSVPVVCGVGHEVDVTLADFAADVRAPTPSAAAEIVVPDRADLVASVMAAGARLTAAAERSIAHSARELAAERRALDRLDPVARLVTSRERVGLLLDRASREMALRLRRDRERTTQAGGRLPVLAARRLDRSRAGLAATTAALAALGPQATLERGYAIVSRRIDGTIIREPEQAPGGTAVRIKVARGELPATADDR
ncbi:MAG: exodeoxyribonuclease VII large subunit [Chloroflexota bacterium]